MKKVKKKITLHRETLRSLQPEFLIIVNGAEEQVTVDYRCTPLESVGGTCYKCR